MDVLKRDRKLCERLTNLIATGWLVRRFVPEWQENLSRERKGEQREQNTLEDNAKGAFTDLFPDTEVVTDDAGSGRGLRGMIRRRGYYMWGCHRESERDGKGKGGTKAGAQEGEEREGKTGKLHGDAEKQTNMAICPNSVPCSHALLPHISTRLSSLCRPLPHS